MRLKRVRTFATTVTLAALVTLSAAACTNNATVRGGGGSSAPPVSTDTNGDPRAAVSLAGEKAKQESYRMTMTMDPELSMESSVDPLSKSGHSTMSMTSGAISMRVETIIIGDDFYVKADGGPFTSDKWMHTDDERISEAISLGQQFDPAEFLTEVDDVVQVDEHTYTGTIDLSTLNLGAFSSKTDDKLDAIPFTLTLDDQGRMTRMETTVENATGDGTERTIVVTMGDFGVPVTVTAPPADQTEEAPFGK